MANGTENTDNEEGGINWGSLIDDGINLITTGIGAASSSTTLCGQLCRQKCKQETGWLFSGREKCKKRCKQECLSKLNEPEQKEPNTTVLVVTSIIVLIIIGLILFWMFKKKK